MSTNSRSRIFLISFGGRDSCVSDGMGAPVLGNCETVDSVVCRAKADVITVAGSAKLVPVLGNGNMGT